jgi:hypothetical protein
MLRGGMSVAMVRARIRQKPVTNFKSSVQYRKRSTAASFIPQHQMFVYCMPPVASEGEDTDRGKDK